MLGISVYLNKDRMDKNAAWIEKAAGYGFESIFTSLHIPEDNPGDYRELLQELGKQAKRFNMELMADVSPRSLSYLGLDWESYEELLDWGVSGIRADYGLSTKQIAELSGKMKLGVNASTVTKEELSEWIAAGLKTENVEAWHNFYPRPETGLDTTFLIERNKMFQSIGIRTMAFIPGEKDLRGPVSAGLPSLEKHRSQPSHIAAAELKFSCFTDKILIGDHSVSDHQLDLLTFINKDIVPLRITATRGLELFDSPLTNRIDPARDVIRAVESRSIAQAGSQQIKAENMHKRPRGTITMDNERYGRYAGELQVTVNDLPKDDKVNCIGKVIDEDLPLLQQIKAGGKFQFIVRDLYEYHEA